MNVFNVHVNRIPIGGRIVKTAYRPGKFLNASLDKASEHNERQSFHMETADGRSFGVVQIAGLVARRIRCDLRADQEVRAGERFGIIRFGSRVDVYLPDGVVPLVAAGQTDDRRRNGDRRSSRPGRPAHGRGALMFRPRQRRLRGLSFNRMLPNMLTMLALCAGLTALRYGLEGKWQPAIVSLVFAAIFDALDGRIARLLQGTSKFGAELDSLSDFIAFGVAPAVILYLWTMQTAGPVGWVPVLLFNVCMALRLARFNTVMDEDDPPAWAKGYFTGVPAPAAAGLVMVPMVLWFQVERGMAAPAAPGRRRHYRRRLPDGQQAAHLFVQEHPHSAAVRPGAHAGGRTARRAERFGAVDDHDADRRRLRGHYPVLHPLVPAGRGGGQGTCGYAGGNGGGGCAWGCAWGARRRPTTRRPSNHDAGAGRSPRQVRLRPARRVPDNDERYRAR